MAKRRAVSFWSGTEVLLCSHDERAGDEVGSLPWPTMRLVLRSSSTEDFSMFPD